MVDNCDNWLTFVSLPRAGSQVGLDFDLKFLTNYNKNCCQVSGLSGGVRPENVFIIILIFYTYRSLQLLLISTQPASHRGQRVLPHLGVDQQVDIGEVDERDHPGAQQSGEVKANI